MNKITLIKKNFLGAGYVHTFKNDNGGFVYLLKDKNTYDQELETRPELEGYIWVGSASGELAVDTHNYNLSLGEYTFDGVNYWVGEENEIGFTVSKYSSEEFERKYGNNI